MNGKNLPCSSFLAACAMCLALLVLQVLPGRAQNLFVTHDDSNQVPQNASKSGNVLVNDDNPANLAATAFGVALVAPPALGTLSTLYLDGSYVYVPAAGYLGADSFTFRICQPRGASSCSNVSTVALNVYDPNLACTQGTGPNLLQKPSFSASNSGFSSAYTFVPTPTSTPSLYSEATYAVGVNAKTYHADFTGNGRTGPSDNFMIINGAPTLQAVYAQTVTVFPNRFYTISVYATSVHPSSPAQLGLVVNGKSTSVVTTLPTTVNQYMQLSDLYFSGPATGFPVTFEIRDINKTLAGNDFGIDVYFGLCSTDLLAVTKTTGAVPSVAGPTAILPLSATLSVGANSGVQAAYFTVTSLPATGTLTYNGVPVVVGQLLPVAAPGSLSSGGLLAYTPAGGCTSTSTVTVTVTVLSPLGIPNAFSPNGDGRDDTWEIDRIGNFGGNRVVVFNRWGSKIFETQGYRRGNEWDGTLHGQPAPLGTYYYVITLGTGRAYSGWFTVLQ